MAPNTITAFVQLNEFVDTLPDAAVRLKLRDLLHQATLRLLGTHRNPIGDLAVFCWQHTIPTAAITTYFQSLQVDENCEFEAMVQALTTLDDARSLIFRQAAPQTNGITTEEGKQAYLLVMATWDLIRASMSLLTHDNQETEYMQRVMSRLAQVREEIGFRFPPNE